MKKIALLTSLAGLLALLTIGLSAQTPATTPNIHLFLPQTGSYNWNQWFTNNWNLIDAAFTSGATLPYIPPTGPVTTVATQLTKLTTRTVDVTDYGAVGDGVTDNHLAFTAALAALAGTGGEVDVPCGKFYMAETWIITNSGVPNIGAPITIRGHHGCSFVTGTGIKIVQVQTLNHVLFEDMGFMESNPAGNANTVGLMVGYDGQPVANVSGTNCDFVGAHGQFKGTGLEIEFSVGGTWINIFTTQWNYGMLSIPGALGSTAQSIFGSNFYQNNWGLYLEDGEFDLIGDVVYDNVVGGLYIGFSAAVRDSQMHYEDGAATYDVEVTDNARYQSVNSGFESHPTIINAPTVGARVYITGEGDNTVINNSPPGIGVCVIGPGREIGAYSTGTGTCVLQGNFGTYINNGSNNYAINLGGGVLSTDTEMQSPQFLGTGTNSSLTVKWVLATGGYDVGASSGVTCSGAPTAAFQVIGGIVIHC